MLGPATYFLFLKYIYWLQGIGYWLKSNNLKVFVLVLSIYYFNTTSYLDSVFDIYIIWIARQNTMRLFLWSPAYTTENFCSLSSNWKPLLRFLIFFFFQLPSSQASFVGTIGLICCTITFIYTHPRMKIV